MLRIYYTVISYQVYLYFYLFSINFQERSREDEELISLAEGILTLRMILIASSPKIADEESAETKEKEIGIVFFQTFFKGINFQIVQTRCFKKSNRSCEQKVLISMIQ